MMNMVRKLPTVQLMVVVVVMVLSCVSLTSASFGYFRPRPAGFGQALGPRCSSASKPCRIKAMMEGGVLGSATGSHEISTHPCSCPGSMPCSDDWNAHRDRVITRELLTDGNINMTLSMMFCLPIQPQRRCSPDDVALQLKGLGHLPMEVDMIHCSCAEHRPLVLHSTNTGHDHLSYSAYVCGNHKRRCKRRRRNPDICMENDPSSDTVNYPCKCTSGTTCRPSRLTYPFRYICKRPRSGRE